MAEINNNDEYFCCCVRQKTFLDPSLLPIRPSYCVPQRNCLFSLKKDEFINRANTLSYKKFRNIVTKLIRQEKRQDNFRKLGKNPTPIQIYKSLKSKNS